MTKKKDVITIYIGKKNDIGLRMISFSKISVIRGFRAGNVIWEIPGFKCISGTRFEISPSGDSLVLPMSNVENNLSISAWDGDIVKIIDSVGKMFELISVNYTVKTGVESGVCFVTFTST